MDFLSDPQVQEVLKKAKVEGEVTFYAPEGDNAGSAWGYRFDGLGGMVNLKGALTYTPVPGTKKRT
jgi:hypothetical protein